MSVEVRISRGRHHVVLESPIRAQIPCESLITRVLNKALMILFELGPCGADEGGVEGIIRDEPIELRNLDDQIGLESDHPLEKNHRARFWRLPIWKRPGRSSGLQLLSTARQRSLT